MMAVKPPGSGQLLLFGLTVKTTQQINDSQQSNI